jgi:hypothetical protein
MDDLLKEKWMPILESLDIDMNNKKIVELVVRYAEQHKAIESQGKESYLAMSLKILSNLLKDYKPSRFRIVEKRDKTIKYEVSTSISRNQIESLTAVGVDPMAQIESVMIREMENSIRHLLEDNKDVVSIWILIENIQHIAEATFAPRLVMSSWFKKVDIVEERQRKLVGIKMS